MAFLDKVSDLGKSAMKKAGEGVEAGKIALKINEEKGKIKDAEIELGKYIYSQYLNGAEYDSTTTATAEAGKFCPHCGVKQSGESKFCASCGGKLEG